MPAIQVARTDTFELQRQKINQIGSTLFNITQGGSDLSTGNLKLGDGTRVAPSLAFVSDPSLGIYKPDEKTIGYVSDGKKVADFAPTGFYSFRDFVIQKRLLNGSGLSLLSSGSNYDPGTYNNISLTGGSGEFGQVSITVDEYAGTVTNDGSNYNVGSYSNVPLTGGSGSGATANFTVSGIIGFISDAGTGYVPGIYNDVSVTGSATGTGETANVTITGGSSISGSILNPGSGYPEGSYTNIVVYNNPTQTFAVTSVPNPGTPPPNSVYQIDGVTQDTLTLIKGNTYRFDISDSSMSGHPFLFETINGTGLSNKYVIAQNGNVAESGAYVDLIIKPDAPTETIRYDCSAHDGMGAQISIISGTPGVSGYSATATVTINASGIATDVEFTSGGVGYKSGDVVNFSTRDIGGFGSGLTFTISGVTYTGEITAISFNNDGINYQKDDLLSISQSDVGGFGSGFEFTITNDPKVISDFGFSSRGSGYQVNDVLELTKTQTNISTNLPGVVENLSSTVTTSSAVVILTSTTGIVQGMNVSQDRLNDVGVIPDGTTVLSVDSSTQITLSENPTTSGSVTLRFASPGNLTEITVVDASNILQGFLITQSSGSGILGSGVTVSSVNYQENKITLSQQPVQAGSAVLNFIPIYGDPTDDFSFTINVLGVVGLYSLSSGGNGYSLLDQLSVNPADLTQPITYQVENRTVLEISFTQTLQSGDISVGDILKRKGGLVASFDQPTSPIVNPTVIGPLATTLSDSSAVITVSSTTGITQGMIVEQQVGDTGVLEGATTVLSVDSSTQITLSATPRISGSANLSFLSDESGTYTGVSTTSSGIGVGATFDVVRNSSGQVTSLTLNSAGYFYEDTDTITISGDDIGGSSPTHDIVISLTGVTDYNDLEVYLIKESGGNIDSILLDFDTITSGDIIILSGTTTPEYEIDTVSQIQYRYFINTGSGYSITPSLTLYSGNTYKFDLSDGSNTGHIFALSKYRDGIWGPSFIENITVTLLTTSNQITVADSTGILVGMEVGVSSGTGALVSGTVVEQVNGNVITLSANPSSAGSSTIYFRGVEYVDGVVRSQNELFVRINDDTPNLYYYCSTNSPSHADEGGEDNDEALLTIDLNNPKTFGSGFLLSVSSLDSSDVIKGEILTGNLEVNKLISTEAEIEDAEISGTLTASDIIGSEILVSSIVSQSALNINSQSVNLTGNLNIGSSIQLVNSSGNITTSGVLKTTNSLNINDKITISENIISSSTGNNILLSPAAGRVAKINTTSAITIPSGTTAQRPAVGIVENGSIRFNTDTGQYEGYSGSTSSWSSLGGVRDLDGNTYISAEATVGANDNTLYFYNDGNNTIKITPTRFIFNELKFIDSPNPLNPPSVEWTANAPVLVGDYLFYGLNLYEVTGAGTTGTSGNEPTHTTGAEINGTAELTWYANYAGDITFDKVANVNIETNLVLNDELKLFDNKITTLLSDIIIEPFAGKKVDINTNTSLVLPNGTTAERGIPGQGSVRFNSEITQFEGYNGVNWTSLGGVRDVDGNTYIIPETAPGSNENILYFFNNGDNTLRLSTTELTFDTIDQIGSVSGNLDLQASTVTFNSLAFTIDTSVSTDTKLLSTQDNLDLALSSGLTTDPLIRLTNLGDIYVNKTYGTGSNTLIKVLDNELKKFEIDDTFMETDEYVLEKGTTDTGASVVFDPTAHSGAKVIVIADDATNDDRDMIEFTVLSKGSDIFHTEYGNVVTGIDLIEPTFDLDAGGNVRLNIALASGVTSGDIVNITVVSTVIKK